MKALKEIIKQIVSGDDKKSQYLHAGAVIVLVAIIGTILLVGSRAASPYSSVTADAGSLTGNATKQTCVGSTDGNCIAFSSSSGTSPGMAVGLIAGGWNVGNPGDNDVSSSFNYVRIDYGNCPTPGNTTYPITGAEYTACPAGSDILQLSHAGAKIDLDLSGPYNTGGVSALIANGGDVTWANNALSWYKTYCGSTNTICPMIEILNEPNGWWFWGTHGGDSTDDQTNANAYATLVHTAYKTFHNSLGSNSPLILASAYDTWGTEWWNTNSSVLGPSSSYVDGGVVHPYGGTGGNFASEATGNQQQVVNEHNLTGKPQYITEVGWPTDDSGASPTSTNHTGDSDQWPEADSSSNANHGLDQCDNVYNFVKWARGTGYVNAVMIYGYISGPSSGNAQYGIENYISGATRKKDAWFGLEAAGQQKSNPCPSPSNGYTLQPLS